MDAKIKKLFIRYCNNHPEEIAEYKVDDDFLCKVCLDIYLHKTDNYALPLQNYKRNSSGNILFRSSSLVGVSGVGLRNFSGFGVEKNKYQRKLEKRINGKTLQEIKDERASVQIILEYIYKDGDKKEIKYGSKDYTMVSDSSRIYLFSETECKVFDLLWKPIRIIPMSPGYQED